MDEGSILGELFLDWWRRNYFGVFVIFLRFWGILSWWNIGWIFFVGLSLILGSGSGMNLCWVSILGVFGRRGRFGVWLVIVVWVFGWWRSWLVVNIYGSGVVWGFVFLFLLVVFLCVVVRLFVGLFVSVYGWVRIFYINVVWMVGVCCIFSVVVWRFGCCVLFLFLLSGVGFEILNYGLLRREKFSFVFIIYDCCCWVLNEGYLLMLNFGMLWWNNFGWYVYLGIKI